MCHVSSSTALVITGTAMPEEVLLVFNFHCIKKSLFAWEVRKASWANK